MSRSPTVPPPAPDAPCPCGSGQPFGQCCAPLLSGAQLPATAEALMRSRFTAHLLRDHAYLHRTYTESVNRPFDAANDEASDITWTRLVVHSHEVGPKPDTAFVDFTAYYKHESGELPLHEKSEFARIDGRWLYKRPVREGPAPVKVAPKVGRNDPCPCGSGKKYKHCCGK